MIDLDGTMVDSAPDLAGGVNRMLEDLGAPRCAESEIRAWIGNGVPRLVRHALERSFKGAVDDALGARALASFERHYREHLCDRSRRYPRVRESLAAFLDLRLKLACVTNKPEAMAVELLRALDLLDGFDLVLGGDSDGVTRMKPDPEPLLLAAARLGLDVGECVLIGDSRVDVECARAAGCASICVSYGYNEGVDARRFGADHVVDDFGSTLDYVRARVER